MMALSAGVAPSDLPTRSAGQTAIPADEQEALLALVNDGGSATDGVEYADQRAAAQAAGPYRRFLARAIADGKATGKARATTTGDAGKVRWFVHLAQ